jgi:hypothetical protein
VALAIGSAIEVVRYGEHVRGQTHSKTTPS